jgi:hypothetical protein
MSADCGLRAMKHTHLSHITLSLQKSNIVETDRLESLQQNLLQCLSLGIIEDKTVE